MAHSAAGTPEQEGGEAKMFTYAAWAAGLTGLVALKSKSAVRRLYRSVTGCSTSIEDQNSESAFW